MEKRIFLVAGARPNFMKIAPVYRELEKYPKEFNLLFIHTGQHYDDRMSRIFLKELDLPEPDIYLGIGSASHAVQTAKIMMGFEEIIFKEKPDLIVVVGDVNSTLACSLVASKIGVPVAHIEAGLRSFDMTMPEEINRIITDRLSEILFTSCDKGSTDHAEKSPEENLLDEHIPKEKIFFVGNIMIQSLLHFDDKINQSKVFDLLGCKSGEYGLLTLHRPSNVDQKATFESLLKALLEIGSQIPIIFPAHPRTQKQLKAFGFRLDSDQIRIINPLGYFDFLFLQKHAKIVFTDSGGVQEETTFYQVPCLTLRSNTERPITIYEGTNILVGTEPKRIIDEGMKILQGDRKRGIIPKFWDDQVAKRIVQVIRKNFFNL